MEQKEPKGFRLVITDLDSNEVVEDSVIDCFIGGISRKEKENTTTSVSITKCNAITIMGTVNSARKAAKRSVSVRDKVEVDGIDLLPREYIRSKTTYEADKKAIGDAIKKGAIIEGAIIEGARIVKNPSLSIK